MAPNLLQLIVAAAMAALALFLFWRLVEYRRAGSERRLRAMMAWAQVDPALAGAEASRSRLMQLRRRCRRCPSEGVCERWLTGELRGGNEFCPNAAALAEWARETGAAPTR
ncbi:MAG: DUF6455 family protein [Xanthomonadales bacterium]|nr:DUF6455 family protein [Xanthomonadales bacterium]